MKLATNKVLKKRAATKGVLKNQVYHKRGAEE